MVVEDSPQTQKALADKFRSLGCDVTVASSAEEATENLRQGLLFDVIVLDFKLPGMSGPQFYRRIALNTRWKDIPIVPFTSQNPRTDGPKLLDDWNDLAQEFMQTNGMSVAGIVHKEGGSDTSIVPPELIMSVAGAIRQQEKDLPAAFRDVVSTLFGKSPTPPA